jgi:hypothetical protein
MPKPQKPPTARRLLELLEGRPAIRCHHPDQPPDALSEPERRGVDAVHRHLDRGATAVERADLPNSAEGAAGLMRELQQIGDEIGEELQKLNASGVFLHAERDRHYSGSDETPQPTVASEVTIHVLRR